MSGRHGMQEARRWRPWAPTHVSNGPARTWTDAKPEPAFRRRPVGFTADLDQGEDCDGQD